VGFVKKNKYEIGIIFLIVLRGILNAIVPLMDKTEARYAEIARIMQETNNYITPQIDYGVPFWAKPPLSTWLSALSMEVFGVNEFAVRLPYLLATIFLLYTVSKFVESKKSPFTLCFCVIDHSRVFTTCGCGVNRYNFSFMCSYGFFKFLANHS
jgi:hypothetical protein